MSRKVLIAMLALIAYGGAATVVNADDGSSLILPSPRPLAAIPFTSTPPATNADPGDPAWNHAAVISDLSFAQGTASDSTVFPSTVKLMWDNDFLYLRCLVDNDLLPYSAAVGQGSSLAGNDLIVFQIDPEGTGHHWLQLEVSADNKIRAESFMISGPVKSDSQFALYPAIVAHGLKRSVRSGVEGLRTATGLTRHGWLVDIAIPATPLLEHLGSTQFTSTMTFRANFVRYQYVPAATAGAAPVRIAMSWASVTTGKEETSPEGMGFLQLAGAPATPSER